MPTVISQQPGSGSGEPAGGAGGAARPGSGLPAAAGAPSAPLPRTAGVPGGRAPGTGGWTRLRVRAAVLGVGLPLAWLLPVTAHALRVDALSVVVVLVAAMSLVRGARNAIDQFVIAVVTLFGALCLAGLPFSLWPWRLHPVPVAGTFLTALVLFAVATDRRPWIDRRRPRTGDTVMAAAGAALAVLAGYPFLRVDLAGRIAILAPGEDIARHFAIYDTIRQVGGYLFLHQTQAAPYLGAGPGLGTYPQGWHLACALLSNAAASATAPGGGVAAMNTLLWFDVATFVAMGLAVLWAIRRVGGARLNSIAAVVVFPVAAGLIYFADPVTIFLRGFPNEMAGLALLAVTVAVTARPLPSARDQIMTVAALMVGMSFTYYMFLPVALVPVAAWAAASRRRLRRHPGTLAVGAATALGCVIPPLANRAVDYGRQLLLSGGAIRVNRYLVLALVLLACAGLLARPALRAPSARVLAAGIGAAALLVAGVGQYQRMSAGSTSYYYEKAYHALLVTALVGLGAAARLAPRAPRVAAAFRRGTAVPLALVAVSGLALAVAASGPGAGGSGTGGSGGHGAALLHGREGVGRRGPADAIWLARRYPDGGAVTVDLAGTPWANFYGTLFASVMQRHYPPAARWYAFQAPWVVRDAAQMEALLADTPGRVRLVVSDPAARMLIYERDTLLRTTGALASPADAGDARAMTNVRIASYLAGKYPGKVEVVQIPR